MARGKDPTYSDMFISDATRVGTNASRRLTASQLQLQQEEESRLRQGARIQRQEAASSFAQQYEQARGNIMRGQMAGAAPGLTGGLAQQRTSEISGAQMRGLSQLSGQRAQAMREIDYQELMAPRQAFEFAQQQAMAQRDEQMFNLQMIQARQEILGSDMSDEDKLEALTNAGLTPQQASAQIADANRGFMERFRSGEASPVAVGMGAAGISAGVYGLGVTASQVASVYGSQGAGVLMSTTGKKLGGKALTNTWASLGGFKKFSTALKATTLGKALAPAAAGKKVTFGAKVLKAATLGLGLKALPLIAIGVGGALVYNYFSNRNN